MNILDEKILTALLVPYESIYKLHAELKKKGSKEPYCTVLRHVKDLQKEDLIMPMGAIRKNGELDKRGTERLQLTPKGYATLILEANLQKEELKLVGRKVLGEDFRNLPRLFFMMAEDNVDELLSQTFNAVKPQFNLKFFDAQYFDKILTISYIESLLKIAKKIAKKTDMSKDEKIVVMAQRAKKKFIQQPQTDLMRRIHASLISESDRFRGYANFIRKMIVALE